VEGKLLRKGSWVSGEKVGKGDLGMGRTGKGASSELGTTYINWGGLDRRGKKS